MVLNEMNTLRQQYHREISQRLLSVRDGVVNIADRSSESSRQISARLASKIGGPHCATPPSAQTAGALFGTITKEYLERSFRLLNRLRPGPWIFSTERSISDFDQYRHLAELNEILNTRRELMATLGPDYIIKPDIVVCRIPVADEDIGVEGDTPFIATHTPLRRVNRSGDPVPILHASISCKWTMRSDRAQNTRTEALNLMRNRKGNSPHIVAVTAEPLPMRIASLALGTGDLDCVYHFALYELEEALDELSHANPGVRDQHEMLQTLIEGRRLRDISDLPFDLAV